MEDAVEHMSHCVLVVEYGYLASSIWVFLCYLTQCTCDISEPVSRIDLMSISREIALKKCHKGQWLGAVVHWGNVD